jgi:hypothetical protein
LLVPPRRPVGLIALVLIVDLGLAAAGTALLMKGLAGKQANEAKGAPPAETATERKSEALPPAAIDGIAAAPPAAAADNIGAVADNIGAVADNGAMAPVAAVDRVAGAAPAAASDRAATAATSDERTATARDTVAARTASTKSGKASASAAVASSTSAGATSKSAATSAGASATSKSATTSAGASAASKSAASNAASKSATSSAGASATTSAGATRVTSVPSAPQDPYPDPEREIDAAAARSKPAFARCASNHGPAHGAIQIAFQVRSDGKIANAAAVENSTGNSELARCLVAEIASWRVSAHAGATIDMFRPFTYP